MTTGEYQKVQRKVAHIVRPDGSKSNEFRRITWTHKDIPGDTLIQVTLIMLVILFSFFFSFGGTILSLFPCCMATWHNKEVGSVNVCCFLT